MQCDDDLRAIWTLAAGGGAVKTKRTFDPEAKSWAPENFVTFLGHFAHLFPFCHFAME